MFYPLRRNLSYNVSSANRIATSNPVVYLIISIMTAYSHSKSIVVRGLRSLGCLAWAERNALGIVRLVAPTMTELLGRQTLHDEVYLSACILCQNLYVHKACILKGPSFLPSLIRRIDPVEVPSRILLAALNALLNVAFYQHDGMRRCLRQHGAILLCRKVRDTRPHQTAFLLYIDLHLIIYKYISIYIYL